MKKSNIHKFLYVVAALLVLGFAIHTIVDACRYNSMLTSFPFYAFVIFHAIEYLVPSILVFLVGFLVKKKFSARGHDKNHKD